MVTLTCSDGQESRVRLVLLEDRAFFSDGWSEFLARHHVTLGSVILFKLKSASCFECKIQRAEDNNIFYVGIGNAGPYGIVQDFDDVEEDGIGGQENDTGDLTDTSLSGASDDARAEANSSPDAGK